MPLALVCVNSYNRVDVHERTHSEPNAELFKLNTIYVHSLPDMSYSLPYYIGSVVGSRLDYTNAVWYGTLSQTINRLQRQNCPWVGLTHGLGWIL